MVILLPLHGIVTLLHHWYREERIGGQTKAPGNRNRIILGSHEERPAAMRVFFDGEVASANERKQERGHVGCWPRSHTGNEAGGMLCHATKGTLVTQVEVRAATGAGKANVSVGQQVLEKPIESIQENSIS